VGFLFSSKTLIAFLIPLALLGLLLWFIASMEVNRSDVRVAGALVGSAQMDFAVTSSYLSESNGARKLYVEMEGRNTSSTTVNLNPNEFQLVLASNENPNGQAARNSIFNPMRYTSTCEQALASVSSIPPDAVRSITLVFWGENLPYGDEWEDYHLSLEYYDSTSQFMISKLINPTEE
jgi:hypothetical protein